MIKLLLVISILLLFKPKAYAYVDPNVGNLFLQLIIGGVAGIFVIFKLFWKKIKDLFKK